MSQTQNIGILSEFFEAFEDFNKRFFRSGKDILLHPKMLMDNLPSEDFTRQYVYPARFALLIFSFYTLCAAWLELNLQNLGPHLENIDSSTSEVDTAQLNAVLFRLLDSATVFITFVCLIPTAWLLSKLFKNSGKGTLYCYRLSLYAFSAATLIILFMVAPFKMAVPDMSHENILILMQVAGMLSFIPIGYMYISCFSAGIWEGIWKTTVVYVFYQLVLVVFLTMLSFLIGVWQGYNEASAAAELETKTSLSAPLQENEQQVENAAKPEDESSG